MKDCFPLKRPAPFDFRPLDKKLYRLIGRDTDAKIAFRKMTTGPKPIDASWLLHELGVEVDGTVPEKEGDDRIIEKYPNEASRKRAWEKWNDALEGLNSNAKTLRRVSTKMKRYLAEAEDWLPGEYGYSMRYPRGQVYQALQTTIWQAARALNGFADKLNNCAEAIDGYCALGKEWRKVAPHAKEKEIQRTFALLRWVKEEKGLCHFELMAPLINVGRRLRREKAETAESLRSLWRRESRGRKHTAHLGDVK